MDQVRIARFAVLQEAQIAAGFLGSQGFDVHVQNEQLGSVHYLWNQAIGGFGLWVPEDQAKEAKVLLAETKAQAADLEPDPEIAAKPRPLAVRLLGYWVFGWLGLAALLVVLGVGGALYRGLTGDY